MSLKVIVLCYRVTVLTVLLCVNVFLHSYILLLAVRKANKVLVEINTSTTPHCQHTTDNLCITSDTTTVHGV